MLRALAGLYLALAAFWLYAAFDGRNREAGILTAILFAGGQAVTRCVSLIVDGQPAPMLLAYRQRKSALFWSAIGSSDFQTDLSPASQVESALADGIVPAPS
jgi:Domain of unknown function (DUF4345)